MQLSTPGFGAVDIAGSTWWRGCWGKVRSQTPDSACEFSGMSRSVRLSGFSEMSTKWGRRWKSRKAGPGSLIGWVMGGAAQAVWLVNRSNASRRAGPCMSSKRGRSLVRGSFIAAVVPVSGTRSAKGSALFRAIRVRKLLCTAACHYPTVGWGCCGKGVVTGGEIGLQARGGKHFAKKILRAVFVTRCYCRRIHWLRKQRCRLKPTWAPQGATVPHRCNGDARADAPRGTAGHIDSDGGLIQLNGQATAAEVLFRGRAGTREIPEVSRPPSRGARLRSGGAGDISPAVRNSRNRYEASRRNRACGQRRKRCAAAAALDGSANWRRGHCAASAAVPVRPGIQGSPDRPSQLSFPTPAPGVPVVHAGARQIPATARTSLPASSACQARRLAP